MTPREWMDLFAAAKDAIVEDLRELVVRESPSDDVDRVTAVADWVARRLAGAGVPSEVSPTPGAGAAVVARVNGGGGTLLVVHHDTVWPVGALEANPFAIDGDRVRGPGSFDAKAGLAAAISALSALSERRTAARATLLSTGDEEIGSVASRALIEREARRHDRVLVLEPSVGGDAKIGRKGTANYRTTFLGVASHAGLSPERGASALSELARFVLFAEGLARPEAGTTIVPTIARSGEKSNVVPERGELTLDARAWTAAEFVRLDAELRGYRPVNARVAVELDGGQNRPPMEESPASLEIHARARRIALELGFEMGAVRVGGASDGNFTAALGVPTLDGLGPVGDGAHERGEWVSRADLPVRAALLASLVAELS